MATTTQVTRRKTGSGKGNGAALILKNPGAAPSEAALREACETFGIKPPAARGAAAVQVMLGEVRVELAKRLASLPDDEQIECQECKELSTSDTDACPYCGCTGDEEGDEPAAPNGAGIATRVAEASAEVVDAGTAAMEKELTAKLERIDELKRSYVECSYSMGVIVKEIREKQLYKARGYTSFAAFAQKGEMPFTRETALQLISIVEKFSLEDYKALGFKKLRAIASVSDSAKREELVAEVRSSKASSSKVEEKVRAARGLPPRSGSVATKSAPPPEKKDGLVTVLARLGGQPRSIGFVSAKTGKPYKHVGPENVKDAFAEVPLGGDVVMRVGLRVDANGGKKRIAGLTVRFQRAEKSC